MVLALLEVFLGVSHGRIGDPALGRLTEEPEVDAEVVVIGPVVEEGSEGLVDVETVADGVVEEVVDGVVEGVVDGVVEGAAGVVEGAAGVVEGAAGVVEGAAGVVEIALVVEGAAGVVLTLLSNYLVGQGYVPYR